MKFQLTFKTPDVLQRLFHIEYQTDLDGIEAEEVYYQRQDCVMFATQFIEYGENITVEFDTEAKTAVAVPVRK